MITNNKREEENLFYKCIPATDSNIFLHIDVYLPQEYISPYRCIPTTRIYFYI